MTSRAVEATWNLSIICATATVVMLVALILGAL